MTFANAVFCCKVRGYIFRLNFPDKKYTKNHQIPLNKRVPKEDQKCNDWDYQDPEGETSIIG